MSSDTALPKGSGRIEDACGVSPAAPCLSGSTVVVPHLFEHETDNTRQEQKRTEERIRKREKIRDRIEHTEERREQPEESRILLCLYVTLFFVLCTRHSEASVKSLIVPTGIPFFDVHFLHVDYTRLSCQCRVSSRRMSWPLFCNDISV